MPRLCRLRANLHFTLWRVIHPMYTPIQECNVNRSRQQHGWRIKLPFNIPVWCIVLRTVSINMNRMWETLQLQLMALCHKLLWWKLQILTLQKPHIPASFNMNLVISKCVTAVKVSNFTGHYLPNRSTLDTGALGFFGIVWPNENYPEVWSVPPVTPCIYIYRV